MHVSLQLKPISIFQAWPQSLPDVIYVRGSLPRRPHTRIPAVCAGVAGAHPALRLNLTPALAELLRLRTLEPCKVCLLSCCCPGLTSAPRLAG